MKNLLIVTDYFIGEPNSVADILKNICNYFESDFNISFLSSEIKNSNKIKLKKIDNYHYFYSANDNLCFFKKILNKIFRLNRYKRMLYFKKIKKKTDADLMFYLVYSPDTFYIDIYKKFHIPYIAILYDTFIKRPYLDIQKNKPLEEEFIQNSLAYCVPDWFYNDYKKIYDSEKIKRFFLPLLNKNNYKSFKNIEDTNISLGYYGQVQNFRNINKIRALLKEINSKICFHTQSTIEYDDFVINGKILIGDDLVASIMSTKILVILDNSRPYSHYLPSKTILYMSFGKPIIVFSDNEQSITKEYLKDYSKKIFVDINHPDIDKLKLFIKNNENSKCDFNYGYKFVHNYFSNESLKDIREMIFKI